MKCILLAAGVGSRISRHLHNKPKSLLEMEPGVSLLEHNVKKLAQHGITDVSIVIGYEGKQIIETLKNYPVKFYWNYFYEVTNSITSLWFAKDELDGGDVMIMNADTFIEDALLEDILSEERSPVILSDESNRENADYRLQYQDNQLLQYGKHLTVEETTGEEVGIVKIKRVDLPQVRIRLQEMIENRECNTWWEHVFYTMSEKHPIYIKNIAGKFWAEIDFIEDYEKILEFLAKRG